MKKKEMLDGEVKVYELNCKALPPQRDVIDEVEGGGDLEQQVAVQDTCCVHSHLPVLTLPDAIHSTPPGTFSRSALCTVLAVSPGKRRQCKRKTTDVPHDHRSKWSHMKKKEMLDGEVKVYELNCKALPPHPQTSSPKTRNIHPSGGL